MGKGEPKNLFFMGLYSCFHGNLVLSGIIILSLSFLISFSVFFTDVVKFLGTFLHLFIPLVSLVLSFNSVIIGKNDILTSWNSHEVQTDGFNMTDVLEFITF